MDAIVGATYYDNNFDREFEVVGIYERATRGRRGEIVGTDVVVDVQYEGDSEPTPIELSRFKNDPSVELLDVPVWFEEGYF